MGNHKQDNIFVGSCLPFKAYFGSDGRNPWIMDVDDIGGDGVGNTKRNDNDAWSTEERVIKECGEYRNE